MKEMQHMPNKILEGNILIRFSFEGSEFRICLVLAYIMFQCPLIFNCSTERWFSTLPRITNWFHPREPVSFLDSDKNGTLYRE
jgi:hypothetical protein